MAMSGWPSWSCRACSRSAWRRVWGRAGSRPASSRRTSAPSFGAPPPGGFDIHYCRGLGYWATRFLVEGGTDPVVTLQGDTFVPVPFHELIDAKDGAIPRASRRREVGSLPDA